MRYQDFLLQQLIKSASCFFLKPKNFSFPLVFFITKLGPFGRTFILNEKPSFHEEISCFTSFSKCELDSNALPNAKKPAVTTYLLN